MIERTIIISDIHGCIDEFSDMLKLVDAKSKNVRVICLGDFLDRGPDSVGVVRLAREMNLESVKGNHDYKFLKWFKNKNSRADVYNKLPHYEKFSDADVDYIARMQPYIQIDNTVIVHAGLRPGISLSNQKEDDLYYIRYMTSDLKFISLKKVSSLGLDASGAKFWTDFGPFGYDIIYGHNVHSMNDIRIDHYDDGTTCYGIDTGCCFGGHLTALILDSKEIVQVKAKKEYYKADYNIRK